MKKVVTTMKQIDNVFFWLGAEGHLEGVDEKTFKERQEQWDGPRPNDGLTTDPVNHPPHYTNHPSGVECIQITEHMGFCLGNAVKYIWRADLKNDAVEDLKKARWYIEREVKRRGG